MSDYVISIKVTLRERIALTGYWKMKLTQDPITRNIKVLFITLDEDGTLSIKRPAKKCRAMAEAAMS
ncbi:MAG: BsaWI family type II restriction enzyme [Deltaproteobacteria bacterium]|nr:BsaWI family type II restriction enzyme [Deltaproteobacteria bacterium]